MFKLPLEHLTYRGWWNEPKVPDAAQWKMEEIINFISERPYDRFEIQCHTDSRGDTSTNKKLTQRRAETFMTYLVSKGINSEQLVANGYGESKPMITDADISRLPSPEDKEAAYQQNRRMVIKML